MKAIFSCHNPIYQTTGTMAIMALCLLSGCVKQSRVQHHQTALTRSLEEDDYAAALVHVNKLISATPTSHLLVLKANILYLQGRRQESKKIYELVLRQKDLESELRADISNNYAVVLNKLGEPQKAQTLWWQLTKNESYSTPEVAWFNLGLSAWQEYKQEDSVSAQARTKAAIAVNRFSNALKLEPDYVDALFFKAQALCALNKKKEARSLLQKTLSLVPTHQSAKDMLAAL